VQIGRAGVAGLRGFQVPGVGCAGVGRASIAFLSPPMKRA
jgi:hypothetical protein